MTDEGRTAADSNEGSREASDPQASASEVPSDLDSGRRTFSASALAAAVAALALPLIRIGTAEAQTTLTCRAEGLIGVDIGDAPQLRDSCFEALPQDCFTTDSSGKLHFYDSSSGGSDEFRPNDGPGRDYGRDRTRDFPYDRGRDGIYGS